MTGSSRPKIPLLFSYAGQKRGLVPCYPEPRHGLIVEPFAGSAGYARHWGAGRDVLLIEKKPWLARMWKWLTRASRAEIMALPLLEEIPRAGVQALRIRDEAKAFIGMSIGFGHHPRNTPSKLATARSNSGTVQWWNEAARKAAADSVRLMRRWDVVCGDYSCAPNIEATWFVDPPYQRLADMYGPQVDNYARLGQWCRRRRGQVIVCEDVDAGWLPFRELDLRKRSNRVSAGTGTYIGQTNLHREGVWTNG